MELLETLAKEHRLIEALLKRLERGLLQAEDAARAELRETLYVLLAALKRHDEVEDLVFGTRSQARKSEEGEALAEVAFQHRNLEILLDDIRAAIASSSRYPVDSLRPAALRLSHRLREHFSTEETRLWPLCRGAWESALDPAVKKRAREHLEALEAELKRRWGATSGPALGPAQDPLDRPG